MADRKLIIDFETGGLDPNTHSPLSVAALVWKDGAVEGSYYALIDDGRFNVTEEALALNGLTIAQLERDGMTPWVTLQGIEALLSRHDMIKPNKVEVVAHGRCFDIAFLKQMYVDIGELGRFERTFSHRGTDTQVLAQSLIDVGRLQAKSSSLTHVAEAFKLKREGHNALADATLTAQVLTKLLMLLRR